MRVILIDETAKVYSEPNNQNLSLTTLRKDDEFELGKTLRKNGEVWVEIDLLSGQRGYLSAGTRYFELQKIQLVTDQVSLQETAETESRIVKTYSRNTILTAVGLIKDSKLNLIKVRDDEGDTGFIKGETRWIPYAQATTAVGKKLMINGGLFVVLSVVLYFYSSIQTETSNNLSIVALALITYGLMQFIQGILQYKKAQNFNKDKK